MISIHLCALASKGAATAVAGAQALYRRTSLPARRQRAALNACERAEYDILLAEIAAAGTHATREAASRRALARAKYSPALLPDAPRRLEDFDVAGLLAALVHARINRDHALTVPAEQRDYTDAATWNDQVAALTAEVERRYQDHEHTSGLHPLDRARLAHAVTCYGSAAATLLPPLLSLPLHLAHLPENIAEDLAGIVRWGLNTEADDYHDNPYPEHLFRTLHRVRTWLLANARADTGDLAALRDPTAYRDLTAPSQERGWTGEFDEPPF
ncbi:hypothetical protein [Nocardia sp. XZ_19_369]|uniref:hypothetical protein n=1 Tax=Nocardia sp. XZ_19_369 TaxID=2769487 RepID=UPI00188FAEA5|nr:hypothetical protein [Nocardia sp. XZ_19_369]